MTKSPGYSKNNLIWIDLEMTGLSVEQHRIIEIATIITDSYLKIIAEGPVIAVYQSPEKLSSMDLWARTTHSATGLLDRVRQSHISEQKAEEETISFLEQWVPANCSPICGNSIGQDRRFLCRYMPTLEAYFHYRYLDVSTLKELAKRWKPEILTKFKKKLAHKALDDIRESIAELDYYRQHFIRIE